MGASAAKIRWLEVAVPAHAEAVEAVSEILSRFGHNGIAVEIPTEPRGGTDHTVKAYLVEDGDSFARVSDARDALGHLQAFGLGPIGELAVRTIDDEDWLEAWKASLTPVRVGSFLIHPTWSEVPADDAISIALDPGMAFGTGLHPTTQQCLEALSTLAVDGRRVLDVGTGSGILAIAAAKRGAREVIGVDTDPLAVDAALENAERNGVRVADADRPPTSARRSTSWSRTSSVPSWCGSRRICAIDSTSTGCSWPRASPCRPKPTSSRRSRRTECA